MGDFDFSTIIYLIIMIVFAVLGGRRKKKPATSATEENHPMSETKENPLDIFSRLFNDQPQVVYEGQYAENENDFVESEPEAHHDAYQNEMSQNKIVETIEKSERAEVNGLEYENETIAEEIILDKENFDLKKAVIYSEIMGRRIY